MKMKRGQTEVVGSVLVVGVILGAMAAAYSWGVPLLQKSQSTNRIQYMQDFFKKAAEKSLTVSREGGQIVMTGNVDEGTLEIEKDKADDFVLTYNLMTNLQYFPEAGFPLNDYNSPYTIDEIWVSPGAVSGTCPTAGGNAQPATATFDEGTDDEEEISFQICGGSQIEFPGNDVRQVGDSVPGHSKWVIVDIDTDRAGFQDGWTDAEGILGKSEPVVVLGSSQKLGKQFKTLITLKPRDIFDSTRGETFRIDFNPMSGYSTVGRGTFKLIFKQTGERKEIEGNKTIRIVSVDVGLE